MDRIIGAALFAIVIAFIADMTVGRIVVKPQHQQDKIQPVAAAKIIRRGDAEEDRTQSRSVQLKAGRGGHFFTPVTINGKQVDVLVDTGASYVFFSYDQAKKLGINIAPSEFKYTSKTANGTISVASVTLRSIRLGGIKMQNVQAAVAQKGVQSEKILLGNSFLSRLSEVTIKNNILTLRQ